MHYVHPNHLRYPRIYNTIHTHPFIPFLPSERDTHTKEREREREKSRLLASEQTAGFHM